jgi:hypothetical protein
LIRLRLNDVEGACTDFRNASRFGDAGAGELLQNYGK